jgi:serine/threonine-protein kinase
MLGFAAGTPVAGRYLLVERLAASPGAQIWSAFDDVLGRPVAVKFFPLASGDQHSLTALRSRARAAARIGHPHLAAVHDVGEAFAADGTPMPFVVLAFIEGEPLADRLAEGSLAWEQAAQVVAQVAAALVAAHRRGLIHGDLSPASVMLTATGAVLLGLVGSAQLGWDAGAATEAGDLRDLGELVAACTDAPPALSAVCLRAADPAEPSADIAAAFAALVSPHAAPLRPRHAASRRRFGLATVSLMGAVVAAGVGGVTAGALPTLLPTGEEPTGAATPSTGAASPSGSASMLRSQPSDGATPTAGPSGGPGMPPATGTTTPGVTKAGGQSARPSFSAAADQVTTALGQLRDSVTAGRARGEITASLAADLDAAIADMAIDASLGRSLKGRLTSFGRRIDLGERTGDVTQARAAALRAAIADVAVSG